MKIKAALVNIVIIFILILFYPLFNIFEKHEEALKNLTLYQFINDYFFIKTSFCKYYNSYYISKTLKIKSNNNIYYINKNKNLLRLLKINNILKSDNINIDDFDYFIKLDTNKKYIYITDYYILRYHNIKNKLLNIALTYELCKLLKCKNYKRTILI